MKILYYFAELPTPMYTWQHIHIFEELKHYGIEIIVFNPLKYRSIEEANECVIKEANEHKYDLFLTGSFPNHLYASTVEQIRFNGLKTVLISWDNLELPYLHKANAKSFDLIWVTSKETKYIFEKWGCKKVIFQPYAANPYFFKPNIGEPINTVGFIGSPYGSRANILNKLLISDIDCSVYSNALFNKGYNSSLGKKQTYQFKTIMWKLNNYLRFEIGRKVLFSIVLNKLSKEAALNLNSTYLHKKMSVSDEEMVMLYSNFALSLNIAELRDTGLLKKPIPKVHLRSFEIPMSGGLQFVRYFDEMSEYFEEDKEIIFYRNYDEMIDKARFYLNPKNENTINSMKIAARKRAEGEHTWTIRFNNLLKEL